MTILYNGMVYPEAEEVIRAQDPNIPKIEYYRRDDCQWVELHRTGKTKTETGPGGTYTYIQHRGKFGFKSWIGRDKIAMLNERTMTIKG